MKCGFLYGLFASLLTGAIVMLVWSITTAMNVHQQPSAIFYVYIDFLILIAVLCFLALRATRRAPSDSNGRWATFGGAVLGCFVGLPIVAAFASAVIITVIVAGGF
jgi:uncharacterized protein YqgC (DUF456 family)